jgi:PAS domain S-box-containing protein
MYEKDKDLQHLAAIVRDSDDAILGKSLEGIITSWNRGAERIYGYTAEEAIGRTIAILVPPDREDELPKILQKLTQGEGINHYDTLRLTKDGRLVNISLTISPLRDASGGITGASSIGRDVTKQKEAEDALRESARAYKLLMEQASDAILVSYPDQPLIEVNQRASDMLGYTREELLQFRSEGGVLPEGFSALPFRLDEILEGDIVYAERTVQRKDGTSIVTELSARRLDDGRIVTIARDITARKQVEEALQKKEAQLSEAQAIAHIGSWETDIATGEEIWSDELYRIYGVEPQSHKASLEAFIEYVHPDDREMARTEIEQANMTVGLFAYEARVLRPDGSVRTVYSQGRVIGDENGKPSKAVGTGQDITEQRRAEGAREAHEASEQANRAKSEFLSRMSHELRTPLNAILGFGQLLQMEETTPEQKEGLGYIVKAGQHLLSLINEVLDITRIEEGTLTISIEPIFVRDILQESLNLLQPLAAQRQIKMQTDLAGLNNCYVMADQQRLTQVMVNLLANAIKFNSEGGVVNVTCSTLRHAAEVAELGQDPKNPQTPARVRISVSDSGCGLSPDMVARLFTPFDRLGAERGDIEGTGLGLVLAKHLVEAMGGAIGVDSELGVGSTFWVELSQAEGVFAQVERKDTGPLAYTVDEEGARTILYIEDNPSNLRLVELILGKRKDLKVISAMQGQMGLDMASLHRPDLILLDRHLPDMMGDEVLRQLLEDLRTASIPVVMLSADATPREVETLLAAGAQAYLTKPIDVKHLLKVIEEILTRTTGKALYSTRV